jgi:hypothetical protein
LTEEQRKLERWMLALRLEDGFPSDWLSNERRKLKAVTLQSEGLLEAHPKKAGFLRLTARGFAVSDQIIAQFA